MEIIQTFKSMNTSNTINTKSQSMHHTVIPKDASRMGTTASTATSPTDILSSIKISTSTINPTAKNLRHTSQQTAPNVAEYSQIPHNSARPPPYAYQRQHEFPPFPPLMRHPALPFLTTAFADQRSEPSQTKIHPTAMPMKQRNVQNHISTIPTMDVSKNDSTAVFIHPPFVIPAPPGETIPGSAINPTPARPLTYAILHNHRDWFLDSDDFKKDNPNRVDYPPELEPPRGWAPLNECLHSGAIKKQKEKLNTVLRTKGSYATPELMGVIEYGPSDDCHELTVLRCTFCRREYHGPNAKSMWRRHVYDKHKVAMKNRREGSTSSAIRNVLKKPQSKSSSESFNMSSPNVAPSLLDLYSEENMIRLLERVISGDLHDSLPASVLGGNTIRSQSIVNKLRKSSPIKTLHHDFLEIISASQSQFTCSQSTDSGEPEMFQQMSRSSPNESTEDRESPRPQYRKTEVTDNVKCSLSSERTPLRDNTFADRNYHNSAGMASGMPRKDRAKQQKTISKSPVVRLAQTMPILSPKPFNSCSNHPNHRSLTSTALRTRALATTGEESYLTLLVSSPSTAANSPFKPLASPSANRLSPSSKVKHRESYTASDDFGIPTTPSFRFPFIDFNVEASNNPAFSIVLASDPVKVDAKGPLLLSAALAPPALVDEKPNRLTSSFQPAKAGIRISKQDVTTAKQKSRFPESSPLQRLQRREFAKNDNESYDDDDFDMENFLDLKDSEANLSHPPSPPKIALPHGFAKEFGLLSQDEVDRITASLRPEFGENLRNPKRRRIDLSS